MGIRAVLDTEAALIIATTLHSLGVVAVVAALVTHLAWYRKLKQGVHIDALRKATFILTVNGVAMNLVGGFMRTYLPAHPTITDTADSPWVQVMLLKHAFIFAALGALIYLDQVVTPRLARALHEKSTVPKVMPRGMAISTWIIVTGVVIASVLGAMAQITPLTEDEEDHVMPPDVVVEDGRTIHYVNATGSISNLPLTGGTASTGTFNVGPTFILMEATLAWSDPVANLDLRLEAPSGDADDAVIAAGNNGRADIVVAGPMAGEWTYQVFADAPALNVAWQLVIRLSTISVEEEFLAETVTIPPGTFFEINTQMPLNGTFSWDWTASAEVAFDVHSHFDGEVQYLVEETGTEGRGSFTNEREGGYSLLWDNIGNTPVSLTYRVWGEFEVDSYFPPR